MVEENRRGVFCPPPPGKIGLRFVFLDQRSCEFAINQMSYIHLSLVEGVCVFGWGGGE